MKISRFIQNNYHGLAAFIICFSIFLGLWSVWDDAPIVDEIPHIGSGYSYIEKGDYRLNPEHPPLPKDLAGIGAQIASWDDVTPFTTKNWLTDLNGQWDFGRFFIFNSGNDTDRIILYAKLPMFLFFLFSGILILKFASKLYGHQAAILALFLFALSPTVMAHSRFVTTDVPALFGLLLATYFFLRYLQAPTRKNLIWAGLAFGVAQLCKYSLFLLNPYFVLLGFVYGFVQTKKDLRSKITSGLFSLLHTVFIIVIGYLLVWLVYIPHTINYPADLQKEQTTKLLSTYGNRAIADPIVAISDKPILRAIGHYSTGMLMVVQRSLGGNDTYFLGEFTNQSWKKYFPIVYLIKEPLAFWILVALALIYSSMKCTMGYHRPKGSFIYWAWDESVTWIKNHFIEFAMWVWLAVYWYTSIRANLNIGVRHLMPVYGFTYVLLAGAIIRMMKDVKIKTFIYGNSIIIAILLGWYFIENMRVFPYYLTYFNQIAGGPQNGFKYAVDSNIDWGQDIKRLSFWMQDNHVDFIHLDYFGWSDQSHYLGNRFAWLQSTTYRSKKDFLRANPKGGYIAVSASFYMGLSLQPGKDYNWLPLDERVASVGNSIFVWHITP